MIATSPVGSILEIHSLNLFDADSLSESVRSSHLEHMQLERGDFRAELKRINLGRLTVDSGCYTRKLIARGDFPPDCVMLGGVLDNREAGCINGYRFSFNDVVVFPEGSDLDYILPAATSWYSVQLTRTLLEEAGCAEMTFDRVKVLPGNRPETARLTRILGMLTESQAATPRPGVAGSGQPSLPNEEIVLEQIRRTLSEHLGRRSRGRRASLHNRMAMVRRFEQQVRDRINAVVRIPDLCTELGVSQRTLETLFTTEIGMTPKQFATTLRLNAVRRELLRSPAENETIAKIAERYGINHLGRFPAAYQQQFGELPSETPRGN